MIPHNILINKLHRYGVRALDTQLLNFYVYGETEFVRNYLILRFVYAKCQNGWRHKKKLEFTFSMLLFLLHRVTHTRPSFLSDRKQIVCIDNQNSNLLYNKFGTLSEAHLARF